MPTLTAWPTTISRADGSNDEITLPVRGMDSYPVVNECYFRFRWISVETDNPSNPTSFSIRIEVTPFIEFWNQTNRPFPATTLSLVYAEGGKSLATGYQAEIGANLHKIDLEAVGNINTHEGTEGSLVLHRTIEVPENGFQVVEFPSVTYKFQNLALQPGEQQPEEFTLVGKEGAFDIGTYKILLGDQINRLGNRRRIPLSRLISLVRSRFLCRFTPAVPRRRCGTQLPPESRHRNT